MQVLVINTYGGSLLLGASAAGADIIGSYEGGPPNPAKHDTHPYDGFGTGIQQTNFPDVDCRPSYTSWPSRSLKNTLVIAHPPCAAFSRQNVGGAHARGVDAGAFQCTKLVLDYAMKHQAAAIAVESVTGALAGAWKVHDDFAHRNGYHLYRVVQNSILFGVPQWRDRFWAVFVRKGAARETLNMRLEPRFTTVEDTVGRHNVGASPAVFDRYLETLQRRMAGDPSLRNRQTGNWHYDHRYGRFSVDPPTFEKLFDQLPNFERRLTKGRRHAWGGMSFDEWLWTNVGPSHATRTVTYAGKPLSFGDWTYTYITRFSSSQLHYLNPSGYAPVLLGSSWWYLHGRNLSRDGYKLIMGFPVGYQFPGRTEEDMTTYLSKGVCPPVAEWIVRNLTAHLEDTPPPAGHYAREIAPGRIGSFQISRSAWPIAPNTYPQLRASEDDDE